MNEITFLTNGTRIQGTEPNKPGSLRKFRLLATHEEWSWVLPVNGDLQDGPRTFLTASLKPWNKD